jgi:hypothetical protein
MITIQTPSGIVTSDVNINRVKPFIGKKWQKLNH